MGAEASKESLKQIYDSLADQVDHLGWFTHWLKRRTFLASSGWKKVERWNRENSGTAHKPIWAEEFRRRFPDAKIEHITPRLACAIWDKNS